MRTNPFIKKIIDLNNQCIDRYEFHKKASQHLIEMANDKSFWNEVFINNLTDNGYLQRNWTMYEIPFLYVFENDDFYLKIHLFVPLKSKEPHVIASAIHHHNNYLLTTYAAFGSGYETMLFEKDFVVNETTKEVNLKIREHFTQQERSIHLIDAWEPHVVVNPTSLSATLVLWSPDKKRVTDSLRSNPILKMLKTPLRKLIYLFGLDKKVGIAAKNTYQFYTHNNKFMAIPEEEFFAPTKLQSGFDVNSYSIQTVFAFMQRMGFDNYTFIETLKSNPNVPSYYAKWIDMFLKKEPIEDTYAKETINIPGGRMYIDDIKRAANR